MLSSSDFELADSDATVTPKQGNPAMLVTSGRASLIGSVIGSYKLRALIGQGGMSEVYEAEHIDLGRIVAIKLLERARDRAIPRFAHEARLVSDLNHPNICNVYDFGTLADGRPYIAMDRLQGEPLGHRIRRDGWVEARDIVPIIVQLLSALAAVHKLGVTLGNLKPQNVFLTPRTGATPRVKLLGFGVSRAPVYIAPEQVSDKKGFDSRADIWGVGVILYEALSGQPPFWSAKYPALVHQITRSRHRLLYDVDPSIPLELVAIVDRALAKNPDDRFASAAEFRDALFGMSWAREIVSALSNHPGPASSPPRSSRSSALGQVPRGPSGLPNLGEHDSTETGFESVRKDETEVFPLVRRTRPGKDATPRNPGGPKRR